MTTKEALALLFNEGEAVCTTATPYGIEARSNWDKYEEYFCINPLRGNRKDDNVSLFRNILCEWDSGDIAHQLAAIRQAGVPYTTLTYSGGKSVHMIISLETPLPTKEAYKAVVAHVYSKLPGVDPANSNPSRLSRTPMVTRQSTGKVQALLDSQNRVTDGQLNDWLGPLPKPKQPSYKPTTHKLISGWTKHYLSLGSEPGRRNKDLFSAACELLEAGWTQDQVYERVYGIADLPDAECRATIKSAAKKVTKD